MKDLLAAAARPSSSEEDRPSVGVDALSDGSASCASAYATASATDASTCSCATFSNRPPRRRERMTCRAGGEGGRGAGQGEAKRSAWGLKWQDSLTVERKLCTSAQPCSSERCLTPHCRIASHLRVGTCQQQCGPIVLVELSHKVVCRSGSGRAVFVKCKSNMNVMALAMSYEACRGLPRPGKRCVAWPGGGAGNKG